VEITLQRPDTTDVVVAQLGEGQYFGEMQLLHGHGRSASVRASEHTPVEVLALDYETLGKMLEESEATRQAMLATANKRHKKNREILGD
jgi:CRP-like cAMP-binding protein